jgi:hypothetical protein
MSRWRFIAVVSGGVAVDAPSCVEGLLERPTRMALLVDPMRAEGVVQKVEFSSETFDTSTLAYDVAL